MSKQDPQGPRCGNGRCTPERRKTHFLLGPGPAWPWALTATLMGIFPVVHSQGSPFHVAQDQVPSAKEYVNYTCFNHFRYVCVCVCVCVCVYIYTNSEKSPDVVFLSLFLFFFVFLPHD